MPEPRGFNNSAGNKLLVLIDGRSVYSPLFSGVFWDAQDVVLEDVERIEVIREKSRLRLSSRLLAVAQQVRTGGP